MYLKTILLLLAISLTGCATKQTRISKTVPTAEELKSYISIRNSQHVIEHGYSKKKNYASNYRYLTQKYIEILIPELQHSKVKLNLNGKVNLNIELYKIDIPVTDIATKQRSGKSKLAVRLRFSDDTVFEIAVTKELENNNTNVNVLMNHLIADSVKKTMSNKHFVEYIKNI